MSQQKRLFLLDAYALIFRGYYAFIKNPRINSKGMDTSAIMGFMNSLLDVIKREKPDHLAVAFDKEGSFVRAEMYTEYKSNRSETPEAIMLAIPYIHKLLEAMHIPIIELAGCEADDLIGTIAKQAEKHNYQVFMVTPDKDFAQLVSENIFMYKPARMGNGIEIWGVPEVLAKFEIERPEQVVDFLGMMGDAVDNIPGLPGVGEVTAKKLLKEFGSMENLLENTHMLKGKMRENIEANKEKGILSKKLATIICDCDVTFNESDYELTRPDAEKVEELFRELEFRRMAEQFNSLFYNELAPGVERKGLTPTQTIVKGDQQFDLFSDNAPGDGEHIGTGYYRTLENSEHFYQLAESGMAIKLLLQNLMKQTSVSFDTETTGIDALNAEI
ncbi:MAG TPA: 5'-3' exonuclease H3TH domain-containing protein, partial [Flavobacterium sp.]|nr:5'-3' exonuclease H3TH domain-containing protein [Flavobacterium sp.]